MRDAPRIRLAELQLACGALNAALLRRNVLSQEDLMCNTLSRSPETLECPGISSTSKIEPETPYRCRVAVKITWDLELSAFIAFSATAR